MIFNGARTSADHSFILTYHSPKNLLRKTATHHMNTHTHTHEKQINTYISVRFREIKRDCGFAPATVTQWRTLALAARTSCTPLMYGPCFLRP